MDVFKIYFQRKIKLNKKSDVDYNSICDGLLSDRISQRYQQVTQSLMHMGNIDSDFWNLDATDAH